MAESNFPGGLAALGAVALCCALPALVVLAGGAVATAFGAIIRFWPITIAGAALVTFGGMSLARKIQRRARGHGLD
jgi:hypothetical protein